MKDRFFLDTNIFVYAHDGQDREKQSVSRRLIFDAIKNESGVISAQVLSEFWVTVTRKIPDPLPLDSAMRAIELYGSLDIKEIDYQLVLSAISLQKKYLLSYWDSLIISAAKGSMCRILYSEDLNSGQDIEGVVVVNPFQSGEKSLLNELPIYTN